MCTHRTPRFPDHSIDGIPLSVLKSNALDTYLRGWSTLCDLHEERPVCNQPGNSEVDP